MFLYIVTQFSSLLAKLGSFFSHAVYVTGVPSNQLKNGQNILSKVDSISNIVPEQWSLIYLNDLSKFTVMPMKYCPSEPFAICWDIMVKDKNCYTHGFQILVVRSLRTHNSVLKMFVVLEKILRISHLFPNKLPLSVPCDDRKFTKALFADGSSSFHIEVVSVDEILCVIVYNPAIFCGVVYWNKTVFFRLMKNRVKSTALLMSACTHWQCIRYIGGGCQHLIIST